MKQQFFELANGRLAWYERGQRDHAHSPCSLLLLHATGFHAHCWRQVIATLPDEQHVVCVDLRGHGDSSKELHQDWTAFGEDVLALLAYLRLDRLLTVGHSMGGYIALTMLAGQPTRFCGAMLLDPVIMPPAFYDAPPLHGTDPGQHPTIKRRNEWRDWQEMHASLKPRQPFSLWDERVLRDYCEFGLKPLDADGADGFELACPPLAEANIYVTSTKVNPLTLGEHITQPVWVVRARERDWEASRRSDRMEFVGSPTWPGLAAHLPKGKDVYWSDLTHFIPMQAPERVAGLIADFLGELEIPEDIKSSSGSRQ